MSDLSDKDDPKSSLMENLTDVEDLENNPTKKLQINESANLQHKYNFGESKEIFTDVEASDNEFESKLILHPSALTVDEIIQSIYDVNLEDQEALDTKNNKKVLKSQVSFMNESNDDKKIILNEKALTDIEDFDTENDLSETNDAIESQIDCENVQFQALKISENAFKKSTQFEQVSSQDSDSDKDVKSPSRNKEKPKSKSNKCHKTKSFKKMRSCKNQRKHFVRLTQSVDYDSDVEDIRPFSVCKKVFAKAASQLGVPNNELENLTDTEEIDYYQSSAGCQKTVDQQALQYQMDEMSSCYMLCQESNNIKENPTTSKCNSEKIEQVAKSNKVEKDDGIETEEENEEGSEDLISEKNALDEINIPSTRSLVLVHEDKSIIPTVQILPLDEDLDQSCASDIKFCKSDVEDFESENELLNESEILESCAFDYKFEDSVDVIINENMNEFKSLINHDMSDVQTDDEDILIKKSLIPNNINHLKTENDLSNADSTSDVSMDSTVEETELDSSDDNRSNKKKFISAKCRKAKFSKMARNKIKISEELVSDEVSLESGDESINPEKNMTIQEFFQEFNGLNGENKTNNNELNSSITY